jgi:hypothetical protein
MTAGKKAKYRRALIVIDDYGTAKACIIDKIRNSMAAWQFDAVKGSETLHASLHKQEAQNFQKLELPLHLPLLLSSF